MGWYLALPFGSVESTSLQWRCWHVVMVKALCGHQLKFFLFSELGSFFPLHQWKLTVHSYKATYILGNSLGYLGLPWGPFGKNSQLWPIYDTATHIWYLIIWQSMSIWGYFPTYQEILFRCPSHMYIIRKCLLC